MGGAVFTRTGLLALVCAALSTAPASSTSSRQGIPDQPGRLQVRVLDESGQPLVARVRLFPSSWAERVRLNQWSDTHAVIDVGSAQIALEPGEYQMLTSCGPEWSVISETIRVIAGENLTRAPRLRHQVSLPGWLGADLHVHTEHSEDAKERGGVRALDLRAEGVSIAAVTDHNRVGGFAEGIDSLAGAELTTWAPEVGHFNAFPLTKLPSWHATTPARLFAELAQDPEVFMQINHPRLEDHIAYFSLGGFDGERFADPSFHLDVDGLEVWNGYDLARQDAVDDLLEEWRAWVAQGHRLTATGGSDSHGSSKHLPGYPRTYVRAASGKDASRALKGGHAFVTNGPLIALVVNGREPGDSLSVPRGRDAYVEIELTVLAADWMRVERAEIWLGKELAFSADIPAPQLGEPLRYHVRLQLPVKAARTIHAVTRGGSGLKTLLGRADVEPLAFTNPVYLTRAPGHQ